MKSRALFVSNSSSASFIVTIEKDKESLCKIFESISRYSIFDKEILTQIASCKERIETETNKLNSPDIEEKDKSWHRLLIKQYQGALLGLEKNLNDFKKLEEIPEWTLTEEWEYFNQVLRYNHIRLEPLFKDSEDIWQFSSWVTMFNDYDDMPKLLKELVLICNFKKYRIRCDVIEEN